MPDSSAELISRIRYAFQGVTLGGGLGLREAEAMDNYASDDKLAECRAQDEKHDWQSIDTETLNAYHNALAFLDPAGMRFHLPAYLILDLRQDSWGVDLVFHLCYVTQGSDDRFGLLNAEQKRVVADFLRRRNTDDFCREMIEAALVAFWDR